MVDEVRPENSLEALEAAVEQRYWMVEIDVRPTGDEVPVVFHDSTFRFAGGDPYEIPTTRCEELLEASEGRVLRFEDYLSHVDGRIGLMINCKDNEATGQYFAVLEELLRRFDVLVSSYFIGIPRGKEFFAGKAKVSINPRFLASKEEYEKAASAGRYLFAHGREMTQEHVETAKAAGMEVVPSVNEYHYRAEGEDHAKDGRADIERLRSAGVRTFQIDSPYADVFRGDEWTPW